MKAHARRLAALDTNYFASLHTRIQTMQARGRNILRLDMGSPDMPPPPAVLQVLANTSGLADRHGYQDHRGPLALRQAWAARYRRLYHVELDAEREILPLHGSKEGIFHLTQALVDPGDVVIIPNPGYGTYRQAALFAGAEPWWISLKSTDGYVPELEQIPHDVLRRTKMLWLNYPNNPTGATATIGFFSRSVAFARAHDLLLCHDAAYSQVTFDGYRAPSLLEIPGASEVGVEFNSLSKSHNMAGWRVGVLVGNAEAVSALHAMKTHVDSGQFLPILDAATVALEGDPEWTAARNEIYRKRRDLVVSTLLELGVPVARPRASLYIWAPLPRGWTSVAFAAALLEQTGICVAPGVLFGSQGEGFARISVTAPTACVEEAMALLSSWWPEAEVMTDDLATVRGREIVGR